MVEKYWTTQCNHEIKKCSIIPAFRGNLTFNDTKVRKAVPKPVPILMPEQKPDHRYQLHQRDENKEKSTPPPQPSKAKSLPAKRPLGKVVTRQS